MLLAIQKCQGQRQRKLMRFLLCSFSLAHWIWEDLKVEIKSKENGGGENTHHLTANSPNLVPFNFVVIAMRILHYIKTTDFIAIHTDVCRSYTYWYTRKYYHSPSISYSYQRRKINCHEDSNQAQVVLNWKHLTALRFIWRQRVRFFTT